jgi:mannose-6-phosphate isomerase-like protein (cupin superfamily)
MKGKALFALGEIATLKLSATETNSAYSLVEIKSVPGGGPAFLHTHSPQETFWILEGDYEIYGRDENGKKYAIAAPAGATVHVPGNVPHGYRNVGKTMGKVLAMYEPATDMLDFFNEIGVPRRLQSSTHLYARTTPPEPPVLRHIITLELPAARRGPSLSLSLSLFHEDFLQTTI